MIDITQAPYYINTPWQGSDATAPDYWEPLQQAANDLAAQNWGYLDWGGGDGGKLRMPPWAVSIGQKLVLPPGVTLEGETMASSTLVMREGFNPAHHFIDLGDSSVGYAAFGSSIKNMHIWSPKTIDANYQTYMIYSNNAQDIDAVCQNCIIDGGKERGGIKYEIGVGGASTVRFKQLVVNARYANNQPMRVHVGGSTIVEIDGFLPAIGWDDEANGIAKANGIGLICSGGAFKLSNFHFEQVETGVFFNMTSDAQCMAEAQWFTGGGGLKSMVTIYNNANQKDKIWLNKLMRKGSWNGPTVTNGHPGMPNIMTDVMEWIKL
jgi:hypothetical protein